VAEIINPYVLYAMLALGAVGVAIALPRRGVSWQVLGAILGATAIGAILLTMALKTPGQIPNLYFYVFALVAVGGALRVITHPKPVYSALYFILTVIATAGLFLILSAEFMAFALIIVYAGAILITYLFVIMLATQAPTEDDAEVLTEYDTTAREPIMATLSGFVLIAALTTLMLRGVPSLEKPAPVTQQLVERMPGKVERFLRNEKLLQPGEKVAIVDGVAQINATSKQITLAGADGKTRTIAWPEGLSMDNPERIGWSLLADHPGTIEIAGVILLMAMLGAVVLSRKQVQLDEDAKARMAAGLQKSDKLSTEEVSA
jgi:NADH-quinone oxidoreductase subunit J